MDSSNCLCNIGPPHLVKEGLVARAVSEQIAWGMWGWGRGPGFQPSTRLPGPGKEPLAPGGKKSPVTVGLPTDLKPPNLNGPGAAPKTHLTPPTKKRGEIPGVAHSYKKKK